MDALRVVRGIPTPEELAAVVAVLTARLATAGEPESAGAPAWRNRAKLTRRPISPRPGAWRAARWSS